MKAWTGPAAMLLGLLVAGMAARELGLVERVQHAADAGPLVFVALGSLACAVGVPRQVVAYAAGLAYGFWPGCGVALVGEVVGCAADFWWARLVARKWARGMMARYPRMARLEAWLVARTFRATLTLRLLPVGSNVALNLLAGVTRATAGPFLAASAIGYVPQTAIFALLGEGVGISEGVQVGVAAGLLVFSVALGLALLRHRPGVEGV